MVPGPDGTPIWAALDGDGGPLVLLDAGLGGWSPTWCLVAPKLARFSRVAAVDRPAYGRSGLRPGVRSGARVAEELGAVLTGLAEHGPVVLVGHSLGGAHVLRFAVAHPERTAGVVLVDPSIPSDHPVVQLALRPLLEVQLLALGRPRARERYVRRAAAQLVSFPTGVLDDLEAGARAPGHATTMRAELRSVGPERRWLATLRPGVLGDVPLIVLSQGRADSALVRRLQPAIRRAHTRMAGFSTRGELRIAARSGHMVIHDEPDLIVDAVRDVIAAAR